MTPWTVSRKGTATFISKANLNDVTNPLAPVTIYGGIPLTMVVTDNGEPGTADTISITLYEKNNGALVFASNWVNNKPTEQILGGGNIVIH